MVEKKAVAFILGGWEGVCLCKDLLQEPGITVLMHGKTYRVYLFYCVYMCGGCGRREW